MYHSNCGPLYLRLVPIHPRCAGHIKSAQADAPAEGGRRDDTPALRDVRAEPIKERRHPADAFLPQSTVRFPPAPPVPTAKRETTAAVPADVASTCASPSAPAPAGPAAGPASESAVTPPAGAAPSAGSALPVPSADPAPSTTAKTPSADLAGAPPPPPRQRSLPPLLHRG